jgi:D-glycero-D-manno-heptose 1,7-bisphosphate phosphatase
MAQCIAVFLDLQGTLGGDGLGDILDFFFFPSAIPAIKRLNDAGLLAILVTNQSHIASGRFTYAEFENHIARLQSELAQNSARLDAVYCCPHSKADNCACHKPLPGMLLQAAQDYDLNLSTCYVVGDTGAWDMLLAKAVGCKAVLVKTGLGEGSLKAYRHLWANMEADYVAQDVLQAVQWIVEDIN